MIISNIEDNHIQSLKLTDDIINNKQVVGSFLKNTGELSILNLNHTYDNLEHTYIDIKGFGKWYVDELKSDEEYISSTLKLNDITQKFDEDYQDTFPFPATMKEWATWIGLQVGVPLKGDFLNSDIVLSERPYIGDNPSWRNAVQLIAKYSGGYAQKNYDNTYSIKWFDSTLTNIEDWENFVHGNKKPPINIIILSSGDTEDNVKYPQQTPDEPHELRIEDDWNYIDRYSINKNIYNQVVGFSYYPISKLNVPYGLLNLRAGQKIKTKDIEMNDIETYISKHTLEWQGGDYDDINSWSSSIEMTELKDTSTNYSYANSTLNKLLKVERTANKNTGDIRDLVQETTEQTEKIASLTTSLAGIEGKVSSIVDTTVSANGIGNVTLKDVLTSELLYLQIYPTKEDLSYLNISPKTGLGNNTKLTSRDLLFLKNPKNVFNGELENGSIDKDGQNGVSPELDTTTYIELKEKLYSINDVADEHDLISGKGIKRIGKIDSYNGESITTNYMSTTGKLTTGATVYYVLESPQEFTTEPVNIQLRKGYNRIEINDKNGLLNKTKLSYLADTEKTVEGTNQIIIEDAEPVSARSLIVYGNSFQEIYNSKNILNMPEKNYSYNDSSITMHQSEIVINGNEAGNSAFAYNSDKQKINLELGSNYTYSVYQDDNNKWDSGSFVFKLRLHFDDGTYEDIVLAQITSPGAKKVYKSFTPSQDVVAIHFIGNTYAIKGLNTPATFKLQVEPGNEATEYEPYLKKPSPEFPSEIECVEGLENIFSGLKKGKGLNPTSGNESTSSTSSTTDFIKIDLEKYMSYILSGLTNKLMTCIYGYNKDKQYVGRTAASNYLLKEINNSAFINNLQDIDDKKIVYIKVSVYENGSFEGKIDDIDNLQIQLEKGSVAHSIIPFGKKILELVDIGKNIFNDKQATVVLSSGADASTLPTGVKLTANKTNLEISCIAYKLDDLTNFVGKTVRMKANFSYTKNIHPRYNLGLCDATGNIRQSIVYSDNSGETISLVVPDDLGETKYLCVWLYLNMNRDREYDIGDTCEFNELIVTIDNEDMTYEPAIPNKVRNTEKFAIGKSTYTIDLTGATDVYLFFYDKNDNFINKSGYHKLPYTFSNTDASYVRFMFKDVNNDFLDVNDIKDLTIYDINANEPAVRYTLPCNLYYINDEIKDELIIDYENEQTFVIKRVGINAETGEKYALEKARTDFYKYVGIDFVENGIYLIKMESFTTAYINVRALSNNVYTAQYPTRVEVNNSIKLSEEGIRQEVNGKVTNLDGSVKELKGSLELKLNTKDLCTELNGSADKISFIGDRFSWESTYSSMSETGTLKATNVDLSGKITASSGTIGGCSILDGVLKVADANITGINASKITAGTMSADRISGGTIDASKTTVKNLNASNITTGTLNANRISGGTISGNKVTITDINASNITGGSMSMSRISGGTLNVGASGYYLRVGVGYTHPTVSGLNVNGGGGINMYGNCGISNCYVVANVDDLYLASNEGTVHLGHGSSGSGHPVEVYNSMVYLNQAVDVTTNSFYVRKVDGTRLTLSAYINEASSIKMKENILPINQDFIETLYKEVKNLKLYSFDYIKKYINDDIQRKNKYGFMIEDIKEKNIGKLLDIEENNDIALYSGKGLAKLDLILIKMLIDKIEKLESR